MSRRPKRSWAKLDVFWHEDRTLRAAAREEPACMAVWPVLIAMAKDASGDDNPTGVVELPLADLAAATCHPPRKVERALTKLGEGEMLTRSEGRLGALRIQLSEFVRWQTPKGSKAERDERYRADCRENASLRDASATSARHEGDISATPSCAHAEDLRDLRDVQEGATAPMSGSADPTPEQPAEPSIEWRGLTGSKVPPAKVRHVFDHWAKVTGRDADPRLRPVAKRLTLIRSRLKEYDVDDLVAAISHYAADPFHAGDNDRGKRYDDLTTVLKSEAKVETALEQIRGGPPRPPTPLTAASPRPRHDVGEEYDDGIQWHDNGIGAAS